MRTTMWLNVKPSRKQCNRKRWFVLQENAVFIEAYWGKCKRITDIYDGWKCAFSSILKYAYTIQEKPSTATLSRDKWKLDIPQICKENIDKTRYQKN
jgi:hypothetical protein